MKGTWVQAYERLWARKLSDRNSDQRTDCPPAMNWRTRYALEHMDTPQSLLDVGCGSGGLLSAVHERSPHTRLAGVEGVPLAAQAARDRCPYAEIAAMDVDDGTRLAPGHFDAVTCLDVLEHVVDPESLLERMRNALTPGGRLLLVTPNLRHWRHLRQMVEDGVVPPCSGDTEMFRGGHLHLFMRHDLAPLLRAAGFDDITFDRFGPQDDAPGLWARLTGAAPNHIDICQTELYVRATA